MYEQQFETRKNTMFYNSAARIGFVGVAVAGALLAASDAPADTITVANPVERTQIAQAYTIATQEWESERPGSTDAFACKGQIDTMILPQAQIDATAGRPAMAYAQSYPLCKIAFSANLFAKVLAPEGIIRPPGFQCAIAKHELGHLLFGPDHVLNDPKNVMTDSLEPKYIPYYSKGCAALNTAPFSKPKDELGSIIENYGYSIIACRTKIPSKKSLPNSYLCAVKDRYSNRSAYYDIALKSNILYTPSGRIRANAFESEVVPKQDWDKNRKNGGKITQ